MEFFGKHKTIILIVIGILVAIGVWWGFPQGTPSNSLLTTQSASGAGTAERGLVDTLLQLRAVSLSGTIFSDPAFVSLRDFGTQIIPEPVGRPNPFAPVTFEFAATSSTAESGQLFTPQR